jgi:5-methylcytosine-specific restriction protein A
MVLTICLEPDCPIPTSGTRCATHTAAKQQAKDAKRPTRRSHAETQRRAQQVRAQPWCDVCGARTDLTAEHITPVGAGGSESGPLTTLCRPCNSRLGATVRRVG